VTIDLISSARALDGDAFRELTEWHGRDIVARFYASALHSRKYDIVTTRANHQLAFGRRDTDKEFSNRHGLNFGRWPFDSAARCVESTPSGRALDSTVLPAVARP